MRILVCGMPRSMTTWVLNVLRSLIESPVPHSLWIDAGAANEAQFVSASGVVMAKCHHYSPVLDDAADFIVYSYRDLRTAAVSAYRRFRAPGSIEQLDVWVKAERLWLRSAHAALRYEDIAQRPLEGVALLRRLLQERAGDALTLSALPDAEILARVDSSFAKKSEGTGERFDPDTLILPGHRTFQPDAGSLPAFERELYARVESEFHDWLSSHGYLAAPTTAFSGQPGGVSMAQVDERNAALSDYLGAILRESASKEKQIHDGAEALAAAHAALRDKEAALLAVTRSLEQKEEVIRKQETALDAYRGVFFVFGPFIKLAVWILRPLYYAVRPRLGVLHQYDPRPLQIPPHYARPRRLERVPKITMVTPSFRQGAFIERTLASVLEQGYPALEYFVRDGGSDDGTVEILRRYSERLTGWQSERDGGQAHAINLGFARGTGEIMAYLNSDDVLLPGALAYVADYFERHPGIDVVYGHRILIDENDREIGRWMMPPHNDEVLSWVDYVPQETLFWRRGVWEKVGGRIDESFRFAMDWDLLVRFRDAGARFARVPRFLAAFRVHGEQKTSAGISQVGFAEMDRIRERVLGHVPTSTEVRKAVLPYLMRHVATHLRWRIQSGLGVHT